MEEYDDPYPNIPQFVQHPNGGGRVCTRSKVDKNVFIGPDVTVLRSMIYKNSHVDGFCVIEDSEISKSTLRPGKHKPTLPSEIRKSRLMNARVNGRISINRGFIVDTDIESETDPIVISYFYVSRSYVGKSVILQGQPRDFSLAPERGCPKLLTSHIEGELTFNLPHTTEIHSIVIKPLDVPLKATLNRRILSELIESIPEEESEVNVAWGYEPDLELAKTAGLA